MTVRSGWLQPYRAALNALIDRFPRNTSYFRGTISDTISGDQFPNAKPGIAPLTVTAAAISCVLRYVDQYFSRVNLLFFCALINLFSRSTSHCTHAILLPISTERAVILQPKSNQLATTNSGNQSRKRQTRDRHGRGHLVRPHRSGTSQLVRAPSEPLDIGRPPCTHRGKPLSSQTPFPVMVVPTGARPIWAP